MTELTPVPWTHEADKNLLLAAGNEVELALIRQDVMDGLAVLFANLNKPGDGFVVVRVDDCEYYKELVIVAGQGRNFKNYLPQFEELARQAGANRIRTHVSRAALVRLYENAGYSLEKHVMIKEVSYG